MISRGPKLGVINYTVIIVIVVLVSDKTIRWDCGS